MASGFLHNHNTKNLTQIRLLKNYELSPFLSLHPPANKTIIRGKIAAIGARSPKTTDNSFCDSVSALQTSAVKFLMCSENVSLTGSAQLISWMVLFIMFSQISSLKARLTRQDFSKFRFSIATIKIHDGRTHARTKGSTEMKFSIWRNRESFSPSCGILDVNILLN